MEIAWNIAFAIRYDGIHHATQHEYISLLFSSKYIFRCAKRDKEVERGRERERDIRGKEEIYRDRIAVAH